MREITFKIERFDGQNSFIQEYSLPHEEGKTILWYLIKIKETMDHTLAFVAVCRQAVCGACAVKVNGQAMLTCETKLDDVTKIYGDVLSLQPLGNFKVVRDLVVEWDDKAERMRDVKPWLIPQDNFSEATGCRQTPEDFKKINTHADCILCGACASECNKLSIDASDFYEPFIFTKAHKFIADSRDKGDMERLNNMTDRLWRCVHCQECVTKCPKKIEPAENIASMRQISIKNGLDDNAGARHALAFCDDLESTGRLNETKLALKTEGILKSATRIGFALRLMSKGKLNPLHSNTPVQGIEKVRKIIKAAKEAEKE